MNYFSEKGANRRSKVPAKYIFQFKHVKDKSISKNSQYIRLEITKSAIDKSKLAYSNRIRRNLRSDQKHNCEKVWYKRLRRQKS